MMRATLAIFGLLSATTLYADTNFNFSYVPNEGDGATACTHERIRDLPDWKVACGEKTFTAHVIVRTMQRSPAPQTGIEILYWVTEPKNETNPKNIFHSTTALLQLRDKTALHKLVLFQGIENDQSSLRLELNSPTQ